ncbi:MAG: hypothetical protein ABFD52_06840, partial [Acidobacteriota bacterium]
DPEFMTLPFGDKVVKIPRAVALLLADGPRVESAFDGTLDPGAAFADIPEPALTFAKLVRFVQHGLPIERAADLVGLSRDRARAFYGYGLHILMPLSGTSAILSRLLAEDELPVFEENACGDRVPAGVKTILICDLLGAFKSGHSEDELARVWHVELDALRAYITRNTPLIEAFKR